MNSNTYTPKKKNGELMFLITRNIDTLVEYYKAPRNLGT